MSVTLKSRLPQIEREIAADVPRAIGLGVERIVQDAKSRVPVLSGALRDSIHLDKTTSGWAVIAGNSKVYYGHMIEHGTTYSPPRPFLIPALEAQKQEIESLVKAALRRL